MKVADLEGPQLDYWVAKASGLDFGPEYIAENGWHPSEYWEYAGPIIERERISIYPNYLDDAGEFSGWMAGAKGCILAKGSTPLIAAMRCFVALKFGDEVANDL